MNASELAKIRHDLLVWAGYHRGTSISEEAMPRFHEIIDNLSKLIPETIIIQGGTCWACMEKGDNLIWWYATIDGPDGKMLHNQRMGYLIHKECVDKAIEWLIAEQEDREQRRHTG